MTFIPYPKDATFDFQENEDKRRSMIKQIRDLETELENERRGKSASVNAKKKVEAQIAELEQQLEVSNRLKVRRKTPLGISLIPAL